LSLARSSSVSSWGDHPLADARTVPASGVAIGGDRVDLVEENDHRRRLPRAIEQVTDRLLGLADVPVEQLRAGHLNEVHAALARDPRARRVFPVPGGPWSRIPVGGSASAASKRGRTSTAT